MKRDLTPFRCSLPLRPALGSLLALALSTLTPAPARGADLATIPPDALRAQAETMGGGVVADGSPLKRPALRLPATPLGTALSLPGTLPWARARVLSFDALVEGPQSGKLLIRFFAAAGELEPRLTVSLGLLPGLETPLVVPLSALDAETLVLPRTPGRLEGRVRGRRLDPGEIARVQIQLEETAAPQTLYMGALSLGVQQPKLRLSRRAPLVDELGQWNAKEWEGKTENDALLGTWLTFALEKNKDATFPKGWCPRGGTTETTFEATGFFRTENDDERWWLVDPEGHGFFSLGLNRVQPGEPAVVVPGSRPLFGRLAAKRGPLGAAWGAGPWGMESYSFGLANLLRSFGPGWRKDWTAMTRSRLVDWHFNTVASGSDPVFAAEADLPYVISMPPYPTTGTLLYRDFPDVFAEEFRSSAERWAQHLAPFRNDPSLIGYFMHNEPGWALDRRNIASEMLETNPGTWTRRALAHWLQERYKGDAADWSVAWGLGLGSFDDVVDTLVEGAAARSEAARRDLWEFSKEMVRAYVGIPGLACHEVDPRHLNLGMRYRGLSSELLYEAVGVFNVFSIDAYEMVPPADTLADIATRTRRPVLIGAFAFGALDRGLPSTGPRGVESQNERGIAYRHYAERAAADPHVVGVHYLALNDQPLLGRFDGENDQIGFVDVCQRPYKELVDSARRAHRSVYRLRLGLDKPYIGKALEIPAVARLLTPDRAGSH
jgi:hypothetical protein